MDRRGQNAIKQGHCCAAELFSQSCMLLPCSCSQVSLELVPEVRMLASN